MYLRGTKLVIKSQAKSSVGRALSFAFVLNIHECVLHEEALCLYTLDL